MAEPSKTSSTPAAGPSDVSRGGESSIEARLKKAHEESTQAQQEEKQLETRLSQDDSPTGNGHSAVGTISNPDGTTGHYDTDLIRFQTNWMLGFSSLIVIVVMILLWRKVSSDSILRALMIPVIVGTSSLLVIAGYGKDQITPIVGLLGTIAGYILGQSHNAGRPEKDLQKKDEQGK